MYIIKKIVKVDYRGAPASKKFYDKNSLKLTFCIVYIQLIIFN